MEIEIKNIKLLINTNIPGVATPGTELELTSEMFYNPEIHSFDFTLSKYPFFTKDIPLPKSVLNSMSYHDKIKFFFNYDEFENVIYGNPDSFVSNLSIDADEFDEENNIINFNVNAMLKILLPIMYPYPENPGETFSMIIQKRTDIDITLKGSTSFLENISPGLDIFPGTSENQSYITINGKQYTVIRVIWLNDIVNNPVYKNLLDDYSAFKEWMDYTRNQIIDEYKLILKKNSISEQEDVDEIDRLISENNMFLDQQINDKTKSNIGILKESIRALFEILKTDLSNQPDNKIPLTVDKLTDLVDKVKNILFVEEVGKVRINVEMRLKTKLKPIIARIDRLSLLQKIQKKYFGNNIVMSIDDEDETIRGEFAEKYRPYADFLEKIREFSSGSNRTSNAELQALIDDFYKGESAAFIEYLDYVNKNYINDDSSAVIPALENKSGTPYFINLNAQSTYPFYTGVQISNADGEEYVIHLLVDVVGGVITEQNKSRFNCALTSVKLEDSIKKLQKTRRDVENQWKIAEKNRVFFNIDDIDKPDPNKEGDAGVAPAPVAENSHIGVGMQSQTGLPSAEAPAAPIIAPAEHGGLRGGLWRKRRSKRKRAGSKRDRTVKRRSKSAGKTNRSIKKRVKR
jgi:hypothetical protein